MKLIQIFVVVVAAALVTNIAAQTSGQNTDTPAPSTAKPQSQHPAAASADPKKKDSAKTSAASKNTAGTSGQTGGIKVIVPTQSAGQTTPSNKNAVVKPMAKPVSSSPASTSKKTTGTATCKIGQSAGSVAGTAQGSKPAASTSGTSHAATAQKKPTPPVLAVNPSGKVSGKNNASKKGAVARGPGAGKITQPRIVQKAPSKANIVAAAKTSAKISSAGRRDPFVSPIRNVSVGTGPPVLNCSTGKRGLAIAELTVQGTAKDTDGKMMAIVAGGNHRSYFLRENDQICNGGVQKITADSVVFRESVTDTLGRQTTHEVVKKIGPS